MSYFNEQVYLQNKLNQLNNDPAARAAAAAVGWTGGSVDDLKAFLLKAGMTPEQHYQQFGIKEGLNPSVLASAPSYAATVAGHTSTQNTAVTAAGANTQQKTAWQNDWEGFFSGGVSPGTVVTLANGQAKVTKMHDGTAVYQDNNGAWVQFGSDSNPADVARRAPYLGADWATKYRTESLAPTGPYAGWTRPDPASMGFVVNSDGTVTRKGVNSSLKPGEMGGDYTTKDSIFSVKDPEARAYFLANPDEFYAYSLGQAGLLGSANSGDDPYAKRYRDYYYGRHSFTGPDADWAKRVIPIPGAGVLAGMTAEEILSYISSGGSVSDLHPYYQELVRLGKIGPDMFKSSAGARAGPVGSSGQAPYGATNYTLLQQGHPSQAHYQSSSSHGSSYARQPYVGTVDADMTIVGRLNELMSTDIYGNYKNPVVRQAAERAMQAFAQRGLLNSSMAVQAAQEAAISKAIEIAGPDAERFFKQGLANQDWVNKFAQDWNNLGYDLTRMDRQAYWDLQKIASQAWYSLDTDLAKMAAQFGYDMRKADIANSFNLRQTYINELARISSEYNATVRNIQQSQMSNKDKALRDAAASRDSEIAYVNSVFERMPDFNKEWLAYAVMLSGADVKGIKDIGTLINIASDPAQPADIRNAAKTRLEELLAASGDNSDNGSGFSQLI